jgi:hypothetical protein
MADMMRCRECGRMYDSSIKTGGTINPHIFCSAKCERDAQAAKRASSSSSAASAGESIGSLVRFFKIIGVVLVALGTALTMVFYVFPKFLKGKNIKFLYAYIILWAVIIVFSLIYFFVISPRMGL